MSRHLLTVCFALLSLAMTVSVSSAQEPDTPQRVETSTGIYDVTSPDDIHRFSATEIRELVRIENGRLQGRGTVPHPVLVYCFEEKTFRYTNGKYKDAEIKYRLHTPKTIRLGRAYPLIVHLHGAGEAGSNNTSSLVHLHSILPVLIGPEREDFFMLVVQCPGETPGWFFQSSTKDGTLDVLMAIMEHVIAENPIDKKRITATGVSSGGHGVWKLLLEYPDLLAAAVPTSCTAPQLTQPGTLSRTRIWTFINEGDVNPESIQRAMQQINGVGGSMGLTETNASGHNAWRPAMEDYNCFRWMLAQKRGSLFSPPPGAVVHKPYPLSLALAMYILPLAIIVFLSWGTICKLPATAYQSIMGRIDS